MVYLGLGAFAFYTEIEFFKKTFHLFKTIDEMFNYSYNKKLTFKDGTVLLERIWSNDFMKSKEFHNVFIYSDSVEMMANNNYCNLYHSDEVYKKNIPS